MGVADHKWAREKKHIQESLLNFDVRDCLCAVESDRPIVYRNIMLLMEAADLVPVSATESDALNAFNVYVCGQLPVAFASAFGLHSFSPLQYYAMGFLMQAGNIVDRMAGLSNAATPQTMLAWF